MTALEEHVADQIAAVETSLTNVDEIFGNLGSKDYDEVTKKMSSLEKAKYDLTNLHAINSLFWMYLRSFGEIPESLKVQEELDRIKTQMRRAEIITDRAKMPRINKDVAHRIVKHELWEPGQPNKSSVQEVSAAAAAEDEDWSNCAGEDQGQGQEEEEPMETDAKIRGVTGISSGRGVKRKLSEPKSQRGFTNTGHPNMPSSDSSSEEEEQEDSESESESD